MECEKICHERLIEAVAIPAYSRFMMNLVKNRIFIVLCCAVIGVSFSAQAAPKPQQYQLTYDVFAGGLHALKSHLTIDYGVANYKVNMNTTTHGLLKKLADWRGIFGSDGWRTGQFTHRPRLHFSEAVWKGEVERKDFSYNRDGSFRNFKIINSGKDETPPKVDVALTKNTTDILTATLDVMADLNKTGSCNITRRIFDGERSFDMIFRANGTENLKRTEYNIHEGDAIICTIEVKPRDGKWHKKPRGWLSIQEQGRKAGTMPTIWFAKINKDKPSLYVPVKLRVKTDYGTLFMHLTSYKDNKNNIKMQMAQ